MLGSETVIVGAEVEYDDNNDPIPGSGSLTVEGCGVFPMDGADFANASRSGTTTRVRVLLPITTGVSGDSVLTVRGVAGFRVEGDPVPYIDDEDPELSGYDIEATRREG